ncbi:MAG TPA: uracil permease, partial [bacterium]|nr:uracil permease [bacterium]
STYVRERVDFAQPRNIVIAAIMLVVGIGNVAFNLGQVQLSGIGLAAVLGVALNLILPRRLPGEKA